MIAGLQNDRLVTAPTDEPVTVATLKEHLRIVTSDEDTVLAQYLAAARLYVEDMTGRAIVTQTRETVLDAWPDSETADIMFGRAPLASIVSVTYLDEDFATQTVDSGDYYADTVSERPTVVFKDSFDWPTVATSTGAIRIRYTAGVAQDSVPKHVAQAVLFLASHWYTNREPVNIGNIVNPLPYALDALITSLRIVT
jgi:uncharacterized phiE125 gp8 family phage protein